MPKIISNSTNHVSQKQEKPHFDFVYRFFCWCSGARLYLLEKCPSDYNKFFGIGIIIFLTGVMASISGGYALYTVFNSIETSLPFGILWGTLIFFIDWYLVASLKKENQIRKEIIFSIPRIVLAVFLAIVISKPLEMKLFEKEINQKIEMLKSEKSIQYKDLVYQEFDEVKKLEIENNQLYSEINYKEKEKTALFQMIIEEAEGRSPTGKLGKGPVYKEKKEEFDRLESDLKDLRTRNLNKIDDNNKIITVLKLSRTKKLDGGLEVTEQYNGFLARLEALSKLSTDNYTLAISTWFIILLFICIESAPILVKLMSKRGPYDELFDVAEFAVGADAQKAMNNLKADLNNHVVMEDEKNKLRVDAGIKANREFIEQIADAQTDINKSKVKIWKDHEIANAKNNIGDLDNLLMTDFKTDENKQHTNDLIKQNIPESELPIEHPEKLN